MKMGSFILQAPAHSIKMLVAWNKFLSEAINLPKQGKYGNHYTSQKQIHVLSSMNMLTSHFLLKI